MNAPPKVSVVVPCYNAEKFIDESLGGIRAQTYRNLEILCVDDGSTDSTRDRVRAAMAEDPRVSLVERAHQNAGAARNAGMDRATGKYICFLDADDRFLPEMIEELVASAEAHDADIALCDAYQLDNETGAISEANGLLVQKYLQGRETVSREHMPESILLISSPAPWNKLFKMDFIAKNHLRFQSLKRLNDLFFVEMAIVLAERISWVNKRLVIYRTNNPNSLQGYGDGEASFAFYEAYSALRNELTARGLFRDAERGFMFHALPAIMYALSSQREFAGFKKMYRFIRETVFPGFHIGLAGGDFVPPDRDVLELLRSESAEAYLFARLKRPPRYPLPFRKLAPGDRALALYGAGEVGKAYHAQLARNPYYRLAGWFDRRFEALREQGYLVDDPAAVADRDFDKIVIAVESGALAEEIRRYLLDAGVPGEKIVWDLEQELKKWYFLRTGETPDLEHPRTFNEKIQWMKLYDSTPLKTRLADKYLVRDYVAERIGAEHLIPLLGVWDSFDEIDFDRLPERFVLKANHGCGWNIVVKDKSKLDLKDAREKFGRWLRMNYAFEGFELHYRDIPPKIIAEEYLEGLGGNLLDYKFLCFDGRPYYVWVDCDRFTHHTRNVYDLNWTFQPVTIEFPNYRGKIACPDNFDAMVRIAGTLSRDIDHVRVDLYNVGGKIYFGELTFTSGNGAEKIHPPEWNEKLGALWTLRGGAASK